MLTFRDFVFSNVLWVRVSRHLVFWLFVTAWYCAICYGLPVNMIVAALLNRLPLLMLATYMSLYFLLPQYLLKMRYRALLIAFLGCLLLYMVVNRLLFIPLVIALAGDLKSNIPNFRINDIIHNLRDALGLTLAVSGLAAAIKLGKLYHVEQFLHEELKRKSIASEGELIKSQLSSRLLRESLRNIEAHARRRSPKTGYLILVLSDILSYALYDSNSQLVPLTREVSFIEKYFELEKDTWQGRIDTNIDIRGSITHIVVPPFVLLPLVENCIGFAAVARLKNTCVSVKLEERQPGLLACIKLSAPGPFDAAAFLRDFQPEGIHKRLTALYGRSYLLSAVDVENGVETRLVIENHKASR